MTLIASGKHQIPIFIPIDILNHSRHMRATHQRYCENEYEE